MNRIRKRRGLAGVVVVLLQDHRPNSSLLSLLFCYFYTLSRPIFVNLFFLSGRTKKRDVIVPSSWFLPLLTRKCPYIYTILANWNSRDDSFLCIILLYCQSPFMSCVCVLSGFLCSIKKHFLLFCYFNLQCSLISFPFISFLIVFQIFIILSFFVVFLGIVIGRPYKQKCLQESTR